ncbi:hypothetical protein LAZ40_15280 [Cereibacter sphaeroides]|uniref:hypothetical protein n=1 Tax=Cereibacter sphaeroides TaxID=1063 RepID=UPI001F187645|nr:hypothetical protein [Cereibacter sphaeroides]MCE6953405.1 hypothetical protein [Cereibacter sphaeroides]MCE6960386.1 hypothetical protein [Cereibacter sphaeroides]MCE6975394.1 hypothetical protein [Cereibacter sphaeroides]
MKAPACLALVALLAAACNPAREPVAAPPPGRPMPGAQGLDPGQLDRTTPGERQAALAPAPAGAMLGRVTAALGAPAEPGFWLRSSLVRSEQPGRVEAAGGRSVAVTLKPGEGAAQLSLPAFRALGFALTDLPEVTVYGG